jgi:hypothetical protein
MLSALIALSPLCVGPADLILNQFLEDIQLIVKLNTLLLSED